MTASILQQLLGLYFAIIYSWQLSSCEKSFSWEKNFIHIFQGFYRFRFLIRRYFFFHFLLRKAYAVLWVAKRFVGSETPLRIFAAGKASLFWHLLSWSMSLLEPYFFGNNNMFINLQKDLILPTFQPKGYFPTSQIQGFSPLNFF